MDNDKESKVKESKVNKRKDSKCPKKQGKATPEFFGITTEEKAELGLLAVKLKEVSVNFNLHTFLLRNKNKQGFFPPADKVIKISKFIVENKVTFKDSNLWAYMTTAVKREQRQSFADKNIKEGEDFKKIQPIGLLLNPALLKERG